MQDDGEQRAERRLSLLGEITDGGVYELDLTTGRDVHRGSYTRIIGSRDATATSTPTEPNEPRGTSRAAWLELVHDDDRARVGRSLGAALEQGQRYEIEYRVRHADGHYVHVLDRAAIERDAAGRPQRLLGFILDVTERRVSEERLRLFVEHAPAAIALFDRDMRYLAASRRFYEDYRIAATDVVGRSHYEIFPELPQRWKDVHRRCLAGATERSEDEPFPRADGTTDWVRWEIRPWHDAAGAVAGLVLFSEVTTERRRVGQALRESEARYRLIADHAEDVIWTLDLATQRLSYVSPSIQKLLGHSVAEALHQPLAATLTPESLARVTAVIERIGTPEEQSAHVGVFDQYCRDGSIKHVEVSATLLRDAAGRPDALLGVSRDATQRVEAERALRESEARLSVIYRMSQAGILVVRLSNRSVVELNDMWAQQLGFERHEILGHTTLELGIYADPEVREHIYREIGETGTLRTLEARVRRKDGTLADFLVAGSVCEFGGERCAISVWHDITTRKRAAELVRESAARFRALIERSTDMVFVLDGAGHFQFWSPSATELLGWHADEMLNRPALELIHEDDRPRVGELLGNLMGRPSATARASFRYRCKDGTWRYIEAQARNLLDDRDVRGVVVNSRDVTEERRLEGQYQQAQKLESVGRLAGGVAHDFNNLLTVILTCSETLRLAQQNAEPPDPEDIDEIHAAAERARNLTRQLLAFARKQVIAPVALDLNEVVRNSEKLLRRVLGEDVELVVKTEPGLWQVLCDLGQIEQVLLNLAVNARDAMPAGGALTIVTKNGPAPAALLGGADVPEEWVYLSVCDSGSGMAPEVQAHLFEPFFTTKDPGKGTGLGLATVHGIVAQSRGHIRVESALGAGTTFELCFPRTLQRRPPRPSVSPGPGPSAGSETILVIEDNPLVRAVFVRVLTRAGYRVTMADSGGAALALFAAGHPAFDLVITDVVMPGLSGGEVVERLRQERPELCFLYVSGYPRDAIAQHGVLDSGVQFLQKPVSASVLLARVRALLDAR